MNCRLGIPVSALILLCTVSCAYTPKIRSSSGAIVSNSIAEQIGIRIGGITQYMLIRGVSRSNPVLLYIHGGPGKGEMPLQRIYNSELEKHFIVATWDQRGAGKTNRLAGDVTDFTLRAYLSDTYEVIQYLKKRFNRDQIFLVGHSWGALLGILMVNENPEDFNAYVGIGQVTGMQQNIGEAYRKALKLARESGNQKIIDKLGLMNMDTGNLADVPLKDIIYIRKYINRNTPNRIDNRIYQKLVWKSICSPEYSIPDVIRAIIGISSSRDFLLQNDLRGIDMYKQVKQLKVPFFVVSGAQDLFTDPALTKAYVDFVDAPFKQFYLFEKSTHHPNYEESEKYNHILIDVVKPVGLAHQGNKVN